MAFKLQKISGNKMMAASAILFLTIATITGCSKSDSNSATQFIGTWSGLSSCSGSTSYVFTAGTGPNTLNYTFTVGSGSCAKSITLNGTTSGNSFVFSPQTVKDNCGNTYIYNYYGTLNGNTLSISEMVTGAANLTCNFNGTE